MKKLYVMMVVMFVSTILCSTLLSAQGESAIQVVEAKLGTAVENRMITGEAESFPKDSQVFFWIKISGAISQDVTVTWKSGDNSHSTTLSIGGSPWRTWASKTVRNTGDWTVSVASSDGTVLKEMSFKVE